MEVHAALSVFTGRPEQKHKSTNTVPRIGKELSSLRHNSMQFCPLDKCYLRTLYVLSWSHSQLTMAKTWPCGTEPCTQSHHPSPSMDANLEVAASSNVKTPARFAQHTLGCVQPFPLTGHMHTHTYMYHRNAPRGWQIFYILITLAPSWPQK